MPYYKQHHVFTVISMNLISSPIRKLKDIHTNRVTNYLEPLVLYTSPLYEKVLKEYFLQNGLFNVK